MERELSLIFINTIDTHFNLKYGMPREAYVAKFKEKLANELLDAPKLEVTTGNLATYIKLSVLVLTMVKLYEEIGLSEYEIGAAAEAYVRVRPVLMH